MYLTILAHPYNGPTRHKFAMAEKWVCLCGLIRKGEGEVVKAAITAADDHRPYFIEDSA